MVGQIFLERWQGTRAAFSKHKQLVDDAVLHKAVAADRRHRRVNLKFLRDMCLRVIAIENHQYGPIGLLGHFTDFRGNFVRQRASNEVRHSRVRQVMQFLDVHRHDLAFRAHEIEQLRIKVSRAAAVGAALDDKRRLHIVDRLLRDP